MNFDNIKKGDTFSVKEKSGEEIKLKVGNYNEDFGYHVSGRASDGGRIGFLQKDDKISNSLYQIPFSKTTDWVNEETSKFQVM